MDKQTIRVPEIGDFKQGKLVTVKDRQGVVYTGFIQSCGRFITLWSQEKNYLHCVEYKEVVYLGTDFVKADSTPPAPKPEQPPSAGPKPEAPESKTKDVVRAKRAKKKDN